MSAFILGFCSGFLSALALGVLVLVTKREPNTNAMVSEMRRTIDKVQRGPWEH